MSEIVVATGEVETATVAARDAYSYSDGTDIERRILSLLEAAPDVSSNAWIARDEQAESWAVRYHLSPLRANLLRHLRLDGLHVLELGAGMGGVSRLLAERTDRFVGVEASARRLEGLRLRLRGLDHAETVQGRLEDLDGTGEFDLVFLVGVLEYAELHVRAPAGVDPFVHLLRRASQHLRPGGLLVLAIENRLGVKYWTGAPEDHIGRHFEGIAGYSSRSSVRTFSRGELRRVLQRAGLETRAEHLPFPDYKLPHDVLDARLVECHARLAVDMACFSPFTSHEAARVHLLPDYLALDGLASAGLFEEFANSFLTFAGRAGDATAAARLESLVDTEELAWHYSPSRAVPTRTVVHRQGDGLCIDKRIDLEHADPELVASSQGARADATGVRLDMAIWQRPAPAPPSVGEPLRLRLLRALYFDDSEHLLGELAAYIRWARRRFAPSDGAFDDHLTGEALDAVVRNVTVDDDGAYHLFDLEWHAIDPLPLSWFVLRNVLALGDDFVAIGRRCRWRTLASIYRDVCLELGIEPRLEHDMAYERALLATVLGEPAEVLGDRLRGLLQRPFERRFGGLLGDIATGEAPEVAVLAQRVEHLESATSALFDALGSQQASLRGVWRSLDGLSGVGAALSAHGESLQAIHTTLSSRETDMAAQIERRHEELHEAHMHGARLEARLHDLQVAVSRTWHRRLRDLLARTVRRLLGR